MLNYNFHQQINLGAFHSITASWVTDQKCWLTQALLSPGFTPTSAQSMAPPETPWANVLHSFKLEATSLTLHGSHTVIQNPAKSPAGQRLQLQAELDLGLLETPRALGLEEGVLPGTEEQGTKANIGPLPTRGLLPSPPLLPRKQGEVECARLSAALRRRHWACSAPGAGPGGGADAASRAGRPSRPPRHRWRLRLPRAAGGVFKSCLLAAEKDGTG